VFRFLSILGAFVLLASACTAGGEDEKAPAPTSIRLAETVPLDTTPSLRPALPGDALVRFMAAARAANAEAMWELLSEPTRARLGPALADFRKGAAPRLHRDVGSFLKGRSSLFLAEPITQEFAVAAVRGRRWKEGRQENAAYAAALRLEGSRWKLELGGPIRLRALVPDPGEVQHETARLAAEVKAEATVVEGGLWLDGLGLPGQAGGVDDRTLSMFTDFVHGLAHGPHAAVAFASTDENASALAWMFTLR
jgi:hypothetical protein